MRRVFRSHLFRRLEPVSGVRGWWKLTLEGEEPDRGELADIFARAVAALDRRGEP